MIADILVLACLSIGILFNTLGIVGLLRFPDVYTRMHATTKMTTFGSMFTALAVIIFGAVQFISTNDSQFMTLSLHTLIAALALALTNAVGSHAIARGAHRAGIKPAPAIVDRLEEWMP
ncbi:MAG TPA: monovalent cation/H(+) antiporter subunit G [Methanolinea sp.]|nr:monovalent cation/H(+) antiporter subunit G [Methanolinea sp.]HQK54930.1 monovalent cation/H(+) antiporter subunit G [Methanolinea sp.]